MKKEKKEEEKQKKKERRKKKNKFFSLPSKTMGCFSGRLMSDASDQKLFCNLCSPFCFSFDEFVEEKVISPSYSSANLTPPLPNLSLKHTSTSGTSHHLPGYNWRQNHLILHPDHWDRILSGLPAKLSFNPINQITPLLKAINVSHIT